MNVKRFGTFVLALGLVVIAIGVLIVISNPPPARPKATGDYWTDFSNQHMGGSDSIAAANRQGGKAIAIPGAIVAFIGLAMMLSAKNRSTDPQ